MYITIKNDFHNTEVRARIDNIEWHNGYAILSPRQTKRVDRVLCGIPNCRCGGPRGKQDKFRIFDIIDRWGKRCYEIEF
jgi:hypothetical protein